MNKETLGSHYSLVIDAKWYKWQLLATIEKLGLQAKLEGKDDIDDTCARAMFAITAALDTVEDAISR